MKTLYLDSSDYSRFSNPNDTLAQAVFDRLSSHVKSQKIEVFYSGVHIMEMAQMDRCSLPDALDRMERLSRLCNGRCFPMFGDLALAESESFKKNGRICVGDLKSYSNGWLGPITMRAYDGDDDFPSAADMDIDVDISMFASTTARKYLSKLLGFNSVVLSKKDVVQKCTQISAADFSALSESDKFLVLSARFAARGSRSLFNFHPSDWCLMVDAEDGGENIVRKEMDVDARAVLVEVKAERDALLARFGREYDRKKWAATVDALIAKENFSHDGWLELIELRHEEIDMGVIDEKCSSFATIKTLNELYAHVHKFVPSKTPPRLQHSDIMDVLHMLYIPYVDVFRADKTMSKVADAFLERDHNCVVLPKLDDLLEFDFE